MNQFISPFFSGMMKANDTNMRTMNRTIINTSQPEIKWKATITEFPANNKNSKTNKDAKSYTFLYLTSERTKH